MTLKNELKKNSRLFLCSVFLTAWFVSLLAVSLPLSRWVTPTFPLSIDRNLLTLFLVISGLTSFTTLYTGLDMLEITKKLKNLTTKKLQKK